MDGAQSDSPVPYWDRRYAGRYRYELDAFGKANVTPLIDNDALAAGRLELTFEWPLDERPIPLRAVYPDGYPFLRPQIFVTDPAFFPKRHCSPIDGNLCLIGRDTRQWVSSWTVPELLRSQLRDVFEGGAEEDPQGEPAEYWWHSFSRPGSYCLIDSSWSLLTVDQPGKLKVLYCAKLGASGEPIFRAVVTSITDASGREVAVWNGPLPIALRGNDARETEIPWERSRDELLPKPKSEDEHFGLPDLVRSQKQPSSPFDFAPDSSQRGKLLAFLYPSETQFQQHGDSWLFVLLTGKRSAFYPGKAREQIVNFHVIRTLRAGRHDLISRAPALSRLSTKSVALIGTGAVGAPLAIELARNGIAELRLMDFDVVEPGNTLRWPLGTTAWGMLKSEALAKFIESEYPYTKVTFVNHCLGAFSNESGMGDSTALADTLMGVDLVIDGTASFGTMMLIREEARSRTVPLVFLYASPSVAGGVVGISAPDGACPVCLEFAWQDEPNTIKPPPGMFEEVELIQPPGCAERTFSGTSFDLQELSLQAMRVALGLLTGDAKTPPSRVYTLVFQNDSGVRCPSWRQDLLLPHPQCSCQK